jgi:hypothetical protein
MRILAICATAAFALAAPAFAQENDTLTLLTTKGATMNANLQGQAVTLSMAYKADGTYTASVDGQELGGGTWKIDGDKLCTASQLGESCTVYPAGKKSGDEFKVTHAQLGEVTVKIN